MRGRQPARYKSIVVGDLPTNKIWRILLHMNEEDIKQRNRLRQKTKVLRAQKYVYEWLSSHPCVDCNNSDIRVLDFDHVRGNKKYNIGRMVFRGYGVDTIQEEINKCDVRCKNCHAIATYNRAGGSWRDGVNNGPVGIFISASLKNS